VIEPVWLSAETVIYINEQVVTRTGEPFLLRDRGLLESALAKPQNEFYYLNVEDVASLETTLLFGIARNHPFAQGNKRTGFLSAVDFVEINGYTIDVDDDEFLFGRLVVEVLEQKLDDEGFADILRSMIREI
jgi:death on curing protein